MMQCLNCDGTGYIDDETACSYEDCCSPGWDCSTCKGTGELDAIPVTLDRDSDKIIGWASTAEDGSFQVSYLEGSFLDKTLNQDALNYLSIYTEGQSTNDE